MAGRSSSNNSVSVWLYVGVCIVKIEHPNKDLSKPKKSRKSKRKDKVATDLAREIWRHEGRCEHCKVDRSKAQMQGAHIFGVGAYPRLRDDLRNGLCLCSVDHRMFTDNPLAFADWIRTTKYAQYLLPLMEKNRLFEKRDWEQRIEELKDIRRALRDGELTLDDARKYE